MTHTLNADLAKRGALFAQGLNADLAKVQKVLDDDVFGGESPLVLFPSLRWPFQHELTGLFFLVTQSG